MALDTRDRRASALLAGLRGGLLPSADGSVDQPDRQQLSTIYRGLPAQSLEDVEERASMLGLGLPFGFPFPVPNGSIIQRDRQHLTALFRGLLAEKISPADRRASMIGFGLAFGFPLPLPDGDLNQRDRQQAAHSYRGISAQVVSPEDRRASMLGVGLPFGFPLPRPSGMIEAPTHFDRQQLANSYNGILADAPVGGITGATLSGNEVVELATNGTPVGTVIPEGAGSPVTFSLLNSAGGAFAIGAATGEITVANGTLLDFEASPADKSITVQIDDGASTLIKAFTIIVLNAGPTDFDMSNQSVAEMSTAGTLVGTVTNIVDGTAPYSFAFASGGNPSGLFDIDGSGNVTVASGSPLDFESSPTHQIAIEVTDAQGESFAKSFAITVTDVAEGNVINISPINGSILAGLQDKYDNEASDGDILQLPADLTLTESGNNFFTDRAGGPRVHIRGATSFTPDPDEYLAADDDTSFNAAKSNFEPGTKITVNTGGSANLIRLSNVPGITMSRIWCVGRKDTNTDRFVTVLGDALEDFLYYWNRSEFMDGGHVRFGENFGVDTPPVRALVTDNWFNWTPSAIAALAYSRTNSSGVYESYTPTPGGFDMPYMQRCIGEDLAHMFDWTRNGAGVARDNLTWGRSFSNFGKYRMHGRWVQCPSAEQRGCRYQEVIRNKHYAKGGDLSFSFIDWAGGNGVVVGNEVVSGATHLLWLRYEATGSGRDPACNPQCNLNPANYPYRQQTDGTNFEGLSIFGGNDNKGTTVDTLAEINYNSACLDDVIELGRDFFFSNEIGWSDPGQHPLMPSEIP